MPDPTPTPAPTPTPSPDSTPTPSPTPAPTPDSTPAAWYGDAHKDLVSTKQWANPDAVIESYVNLEKLLGADRAGRTVVLPKDENDAEGIKAFHAKIGVPESADGYELPMPEGDTGEFAKTAAGWFHQAGVPKQSAQKIAAAWNDHIKQLVEADAAKAKAESEKQLNDLKGEWGGEFDKRSEFARRGLKAYGEKAGLDANDLNALEQSLGTAKMLKLFHVLGETTGEAGYAGGEGGGFGLTPAQARAKLDELREKRIKNEITERDFHAQMEQLGPIAAKASA